jgi:uncharacterized membrane protein YfcA
MANGAWSARVTMLDPSLVAAGFASWIVSTLSAGGGSVLLLLLLSWLLAGQPIAPVVAMASLAVSPARMILLWRHIDWQLVSWYVPGATIGAATGGWLFTRLTGPWLDLLVALFLISTAWQFRLGHRAASFSMRLRWFVPVSLASGSISALVGASGLLVNPFYLNYGLGREALLATRAVNSLVIQIAKLASYAAFGALTMPVHAHGVAVSLGGMLAVWVANPWLAWLGNRRFREAAVLMMVMGGVMILWRRRDLLVGSW